MLYFARNGYIYWFYDRPELAIGLFLIYAALRHSFFREVPERQWRWLNGGKTRGVCFKRGSLIGFFNPVIPRVIFGIPLPCTFNPKSRPAFALKSRIPSFKQGKSRIPRNFLGTLYKRRSCCRGIAEETTDCNKGTGTPSNKNEVRS